MSNKHMLKKSKDVTITKVDYHTLFALVSLSNKRKIAVWAYKEGWYCNLDPVDLQRCLAAYSAEELWEKGLPSLVGTKRRCIKITGGTPWEGNIGSKL